VRDLRRAAGLSQVELATTTGMDHKTISRIETGTASTDIDQIARLAAGLQVPPAELFPGDLPPAPQCDAAAGRH
jgi:transcriptional regulator with XRE-family HTH domain